MTDAASARARTSAPLPPDCEALVVGAGFGGLYMAHRLRQLGFDVHVVEAGGGVGGTWYWNRYPGARCDLPSIQYSYSFDEDLQQEWNWTERYATQPEILAYAEHVAERFELYSAITFNTRVTCADLNPAGNGWTVHTETGDTVRATYLIAAVGCLSTARVPDWPGLADFAGETYHTGAWPHEGVDFAGKRVGVIGTGSSGIQLIPVLAERADHLTVFQRTPTYSIPACNRLLPAAELAELKARYPQIRRAAKESSVGRMFDTEGRPLLGDTPEQRQEVLHTYWQRGGLDLARAYTDVTTIRAANDVVSEFIRDRIADIVTDPVTRETLTPRSYPFNTRRPTLDTGYFQTYNRPNVDLVDVRAHPILELTESGVRTDAANYELDAIVFATGYDAMTGTFTRLGVRGRDGTSLAEAWVDGPQTYLGLTVHGFPNFFVFAGPGSPSVLSNVIMAIEQHVEWLSDLLVYAREGGFDVIEAELEAQQAWVRHNVEIFEQTMFRDVDSWYVGSSNPGGKRTILPYIGGTNVYRETCDKVAANGYRGLVLDRADRTRDVAI